MELKLPEKVVGVGAEHCGGANGNPYAFLAAPTGELTRLDGDITCLIYLIRAKLCIIFLIFPGSGS